MTGTVEQYLATLPPDRAAVAGAMRKLIVANLPAGYEERAAAGTIDYVVPLTRSGTTYNGRPLVYIALTAQRDTMSLYLYGAKDARLGCVRFRSMAEVAPDVIAKEIAAVSVEQYLAGR